MEHEVPDVPGEQTGPGKYSRLPDPIRPEQMIASSEATGIPEEKDDYWREVEWMLRVTGGG